MTKARLPQESKIRGPEEQDEEGDTSLWRWGILTAALILALVPVAVGVGMIATGWGRGILPVTLIIFGPVLVLCALLVLSLLLERWPLMWRCDDADER